MLTPVAAETGQRRSIIAFVTTGEARIARFEALVDARRCKLVDREVDVYLVDVDEIDALREDAGAIEGIVGLFQRVRAEDAAAFELVLVGKDGGVKARAAEPEALDEFLDAIDGMPMRRAEIRRRGGADRGCDR